MGFWVGSPSESGLQFGSGWSPVGTCRRRSSAGELTSSMTLACRHLLPTSSMTSARAGWHTRIAVTRGSASTLDAWLPRAAASDHVCGRISRLPASLDPPFYSSRQVLQLFILKNNFQGKELFENHSNKTVARNVQTCFSFRSSELGVK